ncbi:hypothetical protein [Methanonatronarchaeum sp. AMET6-2]|uniref:hypothetical protein n=1 Tax=Methanonatronarchaeum sp. AMET6-2 TaxID=2933293 RepID=UPI001FF66A0C|nr:hypothetical protein [Methanonatronarchaeum sp. AMET6-2]UOY09388.1 hypothetical protein MU439_03810 [Methanonatronarchaeum sp. AMET6-2]
MSLEVIDKILLYLKDRDWIEYKKLEQEIDLDNNNLEEVINKMREIGLVEVDEDKKNIKATELGKSSIKK